MFTQTHTKFIGRLNTVIKQKFPIKNGTKSGTNTGINTGIKAMGDGIIIGLIPGNINGPINCITNMKHDTTKNISLPSQIIHFLVTYSFSH